MAEKPPMTDPTATEAWKALAKLADKVSKGDHAFDLTNAKVLSPDRIRTMKASAVGFDLLYATERLDGEGAALEALAQLADETRAVEQFEAMMRGVDMDCTAG
ncbi:MAG: hypothetical protein ACODAJ_04315, partial [Planctomycetota bacterium]